MLIFLRIIDLANSIIRYSQLLLIRNLTCDLCPFLWSFTTPWINIPHNFKLRPSRFLLLRLHCMQSLIRIMLTWDLNWLDLWIRHIDLFLRRRYKLSLVFFLKRQFQYFPLPLLPSSFLPLLFLDLGFFSFKSWAFGLSAPTCQVLRSVRQMVVLDILFLPFFGSLRRYI